MLQAGTADKSYLIQLDESNFGASPLLGHIDSLLNTGTVPMLFTAEEQETIVKDLRPDCIASGRQSTTAAVWEFFNEFVRSNVHVIIFANPHSSQYLDLYVRNN